MIVAFGDSTAALDLLRPVRAGDVDRAIVACAGHPNPPGIAADLAILDETASHVFLDEDFDVFAAVRARHKEFVRHNRNRISGTPHITRVEAPAAAECATSVRTDVGSEGSVNLKHAPASRGSSMSDPP